MMNGQDQYYDDVNPRSRRIDDGFSSRSPDFHATEPLSDDSDPLSGKIVARMPDLGECEPLLEAVAVERPDFRKSLARLFSTAGDGVARFTTRLQGHWVRFRERRRIANVETETRGEGVLPDSGSVSSAGWKSDACRRVKPFYTGLVAAGVILLGCGMILIFRGGEPRRKVRDEFPPTAMSTPKTTNDDLKSADADGPGLAPDAPPTVSPNAARKESPRSAQAARSPQSGDGVSTTAKKPSRSRVAKSGQSAPAPSDIALDRPLDPDSPWHRPAADSYSPWTMNSAERLEAAAQAEPSPGVALVSAHPVDAPPGARTTTMSTTNHRVAPAGVPPTNHAAAPPFYGPTPAGYPVAGAVGTAGMTPHYAPGPMPGTTGAGYQAGYGVPPTIHANSNAATYRETYVAPGYGAHPTSPSPNAQAAYREPYYAGHYAGHPTANGNIPVAAYTNYPTAGRIPITETPGTFREHHGARPPAREQARYAAAPAYVPVAPQPQPTYQTAPQTGVYPNPAYPYQPNVAPSAPQGRLY